MFPVLVNMLDRKYMQKLTHFIFHLVVIDCVTGHRIYLDSTAVHHIYWNAVGELLCHTFFGIRWLLPTNAMNEKIGHVKTLTKDELQNLEQTNLLTPKFHCSTAIEETLLGSGLPTFWTRLQRSIRTTSSKYLQKWSPFNVALRCRKLWRLRTFHWKVEKVELSQRKKVIYEERKTCSITVFGNVSQSSPRYKRHVLSCDISMHIFKSTFRNGGEDGTSNSCNKPSAFITFENPILVRLLRVYAENFFGSSKSNLSSVALSKGQNRLFMVAQVLPCSISVLRKVKRLSGRFHF